MKKKMRDEEKRKLSELHLIATTDELGQGKKESESFQSIKMQVKIREKVLGQEIKIRYTASKKKASSF